MIQQHGHIKSGVDVPLQRILRCMIINFYYLKNYNPSVTKYLVEEQPSRV